MAARHAVDPELTPAQGAWPRVLPAGDLALVVELSDQLDESVNRRVIELAGGLEDRPIPGVEEVVPTYRSLLVCYDPEQIGYAALAGELMARCRETTGQAAASRLWRVPVHYGGVQALDLEDLAGEKGLSVPELIALHASVEYRVYMIGFSPGLPYLGGGPEQLYTPRRATPRQFVAAGSVGLGGKQGCITPVDGPSGWHFVGWTPIRPFDPARADAFLFRAGDRIRFVPVDEDEALRLRDAVAAGETVIEAEPA